MTTDFTVAQAKAKLGLSRPALMNLLRFLDKSPKYELRHGISYRIVSPELLEVLRKGARRRSDGTERDA